MRRLILLPKLIRKVSTTSTVLIPGTMFSPIQLLQNTGATSMRKLGMKTDTGSTQNSRGLPKMSGNSSGRSI